MSDNWSLMLARQVQALVQQRINQATYNAQEGDIRFPLDITINIHREINGTYTVTYGPAGMFNSSPTIEGEIIDAV